MRQVGARPPKRRLRGRGTIFVKRTVAEPQIRGGLPPSYATVAKAGAGAWPAFTMRSPRAVRDRSRHRIRRRYALHSSAPSSPPNDPLRCDDRRKLSRRSPGQPITLRTSSRRSQEQETGRCSSARLCHLPLISAGFLNPCRWLWAHYYCALPQCPRSS